MQISIRVYYCNGRVEGITSDTNDKKPNCCPLGNVKITKLSQFIKLIMAFLVGNNKLGKVELLPLP